MSEEKQKAIYYSWLETALPFSLRSLEDKYRIENMKYSLNSHLYPSTILQEAKHLRHLSQHPHAPQLIFE